MVNGKEDYWAWSESGKEILQITKDGNGINAITQEKEGDFYKFNILEVYA